ncbi:MAG: shikimate kinase, partial [Varibaculum cambriense]|nr:shikimate kinase [Varibaculum cambriense]
GWKLVATDREVAAKLQVAADSALLTVGEERYREAEREVLRDLLRDLPRENTLVDCGSGALDNPQTLSELQGLPGVEVLELVIDLSTMADRAGLNRPRSLGLGTPRAWLRQMGQQRRQRWQVLDPLTVEVSDLPKAEAVQKVAEALGLGDKSTG